MAIQSISYEVRYVNGCAHVLTAEDHCPGLTIGNFDIMVGQSDEHDADPIVTVPKGFLEADYLANRDRDDRPALPLWQMSDRADQDPVNLGFHEADEDPIEIQIPEHRAIMTPDNGLEGIFAIAEHLGEGQRVVERFVDVPGKLYGMSRGQLLLPLDTGLTNLDKIIYHEAGMTAQGDAVLPHEVRTPRAWYLHGGGIKKKFDCTIEQAETLALAFKVLDTTPTMAVKFASWLTPEKFAKGFRYFENLASEMVLVTDVGAPSIIDEADYLADDIDDDQPIDADNPAEIAEIKADGWHKLDDPRDNYKPWEELQPARFRRLLAQIRATKTLADLKTIGKSLFNDKTYTKVQTTVIWDEYHRRKFHLSPKLRPIALKVLERLADPKVNMAKVGAWLYNDGKAKLTEHEQSVIWTAWKKVKSVRAPKQATLPMPDYDSYPVDLAMAEEPSYLYDE